MYQLCMAITAVVLHHLIFHTTVSARGSALMLLVRDLLEAASLYIAADFLKWRPVCANKREQTYHASRADTLLFSQTPQPTQAPRKTTSCEAAEREREFVYVCVCVEDCCCCCCVLIEWHLIRLLLSLQEAAARCINLQLIMKVFSLVCEFLQKHIYLRAAESHLVLNTSFILHEHDDDSSMAECVCKCMQTVYLSSLLIHF